MQHMLDVANAVDHGDAILPVHWQHVLVCGGSIARHGVQEEEEEEFYMLQPANKYELHSVWAVG